VYGHHSGGKKVVTARDKLLWALQQDFGRCQYAEQRCQWTVWDTLGGVQRAPKMHWHHVTPRRQPDDFLISQYKAGLGSRSKNFAKYSAEVKKCVYLCEYHHNFQHHG
jgi:hypothetical protein